MCSEKNTTACLKFCGLQTEVVESGMQAENSFCQRQQADIVFHKVIDTSSIFLTCCIPCQGLQACLNPPSHWRAKAGYTLDSSPVHCRAWIQILDWDICPGPNIELKQWDTSRSFGNSLTAFSLFIYLCFSKADSNVAQALTKRTRDEDLMHLAVVACGNRLDETLTMIKSALLFSQKKIKFHIFSEDSLAPQFEERVRLASIHFLLTVYKPTNLMLSFLSLSFLLF